MGIQGLLPFLTDVTRDTHISEFENEFVAIDAYSWLHKGLYSCAYDIAMKKPNFQFVKYCMGYIEMLRHFNVKPILVFDGRQLSSKSETEKKRREERKRKFEIGKQLMRTGNIQEGKKLIGESVDVSHELALKLIEECRKNDIDCIVAPYEADAQLAFLSIKKIVKCVITEDSDLLAYGSERVMFKLDRNNGRGKLIEKSEIYSHLKIIPEELSEFSNPEDLFRYMCILSGCDYLPSLSSIGPAFALKFIKLLKGRNIYDVLPKLPIWLNRMKAVVTPEYLVGFRVADNTFKHQLVYDPFLRLQVPLRPVDNDDDIIGTKLPDDFAFDMAVGNIDPITMKKLSNYDPDKTGKGFTLLWRTDLLPNAIPRQPFISFWNQTNEARYKENENLESNAVKPITNSLKKKRTVLNISSKRESISKRGASKIPDCGFIFDPKIEKKNVTTESNLLSSRYFSFGKSKGEKKEQIENANDRRKDESHEDYLQRLYNEYFPLGEESATKQSSDNGVPETDDCVSKRGCSLCRNDDKNCTCLNENLDASGSLTDDLSKDGEQINKSNENASGQHFLLDEIYKSQMEKVESVTEEKEETEEEKLRKVSPSQSLSFNFSKILSKITETPKREKTEMVEKENAEMVCVEKPESERPSSPVFKVQRGGKVLKRNCGLGNISDTAGTPTSIYFSSFDSERLNSSNPQIPTKNTPSNGKMPSVRSFNSVPSKTGKNSAKSSSVNRTLFQFGFKKRRRDEYECEA